jgi:hypothetical protein
MKKAKVVSQEYKQSRLMRSKRAVWITVATLATVGTIAVVVPTSNIPGFGYIAQVLGINSDATRDLTMADFASYAVGARGNKIAALREANLSSYNGGSGNGLSPFSTFSNDRLAQAYAENTKEALAMEKSLGGQITPFDKNALEKDYTIDPQAFAKGFDPTRLSAASRAANSGAMEALAAAAGAQAEGLGNPLKKSDLKDLAGTVPSNISNIVGGGNILSLANKDESLYERVLQEARALSGTSLFGLGNAEFSRVDTRIGRPSFGMFKELGNSYFFSRYAKGAKLATASSDIAMAAFDGSKQNQSIIAQGESATRTGGSTNPQLALNQSAQQVNMCSQVKDAQKDMLASYFQALNAYIDSLYTIASSHSINNQHTKVPGCCGGTTNINKKTREARAEWNHTIADLEDYCKEVRDSRKAFSNNCGIKFEEPSLSCSQLKNSLTLGYIGAAAMLVKCKNVSVFGTSGQIRLNNSKLNRWQDAKDYYMENTENATEEDAEIYADSQVDFNEGDIEGNLSICNSEEDCKEYVNRKIEQAFDFGTITEIEGLPKK